MGSFLDTFTNRKRGSELPPLQQQAAFHHNHRRPTANSNSSNDPRLSDGSIRSSRSVKLQPVPPTPMSVRSARPPQHRPSEHVVISAATSTRKIKVRPVNNLLICRALAIIQSGSIAQASCITGKKEENKTWPSSVCVKWPISAVATGHIIPPASWLLINWRGFKSMWVRPIRLLSNPGS